jgi:hypothetical protein
MLPPTVAAQGACTAPGLLPLVDAAFKHPAGPAAHELADRVCPRCPIQESCLIKALDDGEHGVWGGLSERARRKRVKRSPAYNMRNTDPAMVDGRKPGAHPYVRRGGRPFDSRAERLSQLGVKSADVRGWARDHDVPVADRGLPGLNVIERYATAHDMAAA